MSSKNIPSKNKDKKSEPKSGNSTDYLYQFFVQEDKFNEELKKEFDEEMLKKIENHAIKLSNVTEKDPFLDNNPQDPPVNDEESEDIGFSDGTHSSSSDNSEAASEASVSRSPYAKKIEHAPFVPVIPPPVAPRSRDYENSPRPSKEHIPDKPILGEELINNAQEFFETPAERRQRGLDYYAKLQDLVERHGVTLSRHYTMDDDPDIMQAEYLMLVERRNKINQTKFYKQLLLNGICGIEFLNEKYDPFSLKLSGWSKQIAMELDDYTEVIEELYDKYSSRGGKMPPEMKLVMKLLIGCISYHVTNQLFGSSGLGDAIKSNPSLISKITGGLTNFNSKQEEPKEEFKAPPKNKDILEKIKQRNRNKVTTDAPQSELPTTTESRDLREEEIRKQKIIEQEMKMKAMELELERTKRMASEMAERSRQVERENIQRNRPIIIPAPEIYKKESIIEDSEITDIKSDSSRSYNNIRSAFKSDIKSETNRYYDNARSTSKFDIKSERDTSRNVKSERSDTGKNVYKSNVKSESKKPKSNNFSDFADTLTEEFSLDDLLATATSEKKKKKGKVDSVTEGMSSKKSATKQVVRL